MRIDQVQGDHDARDATGLVCATPGCGAEVRRPDFDVCGYWVGTPDPSGYGCGGYFCDRHLWVAFDADWPILCNECSAIAGRTGVPPPAGTR
jgi:hypothetical protein